VVHQGQQKDAGHQRERGQLAVIEDPVPKVRNEKVQLDGADDREAQLRLLELEPVGGLRRSEALSNAFEHQSSLAVPDFTAYL
jgi:hypothetical protein